MRVLQISRVAQCFFLAVVIPTTAFGQSDVVGGPLTGPTVLDAPFSADATTWLFSSPDGGASATEVKRIASARYYRDHAGRVRVEQLIADVKEPNSERPVRVTILPDPTKDVIYVLDPVTRTARREIRGLAGLAVGGGATFAFPIGESQFLIISRGERLRRRYGLGSDAVEEESLGPRTHEGIEASGRRITTRIPRGRAGNSDPVEAVEERWESLDLRLLLYTTFAFFAPGVGSNLTYSLSNVRRTEPPPDLFVVPPDYVLEESWGYRPVFSLKYAEPPRGARGK